RTSTAPLRTGWSWRSASRFAFRPFVSTSLLIDGCGCVPAQRGGGGDSRRGFFPPPTSHHPHRGPGFRVGPQEHRGAGNDQERRRAINSTASGASRTIKGVGAVVTRRVGPVSLRRTVAIAGASDGGRVTELRGPSTGWRSTAEEISVRWHPRPTFYEKSL